MSTFILISRRVHVFSTRIFFVRVPGKYASYVRTYDSTFASRTYDYNRTHVLHVLHVHLFLIPLDKRIIFVYGWISY